VNFRRICDFSSTTFDNISKLLWSYCESGNCSSEAKTFFASDIVFVKIYPEKITIYYTDEEIAQHRRRYGHFEWAIDIDHFRQTFLKKPGALANSVALKQAAPGLKEIYTSYYIGCEKDFIELLEVVSSKGMDKVRQAIAKLESISPGGVSTDKIKMIVQRDGKPEIKVIDKENDQIEAFSKDILTGYAAMLNLSTCEEVKVI